MGFLLLTGIVLYHLSLGYGRKNTEIYIDGAAFLKGGDMIYKEGEPLLTIETMNLVSHTSPLNKHLQIDCNYH